jgi:DNA-binding beta-propeller fold protein YncE
VTVIDGDSNSTTTISVGSSPDLLAVDPATNKTYISNHLWVGEVTMIDGTSGSTNEVTVGQRDPHALAVDPTLNRIYVANLYSNTVSVIAGARSPLRCNSFPLFPAVWWTRAWRTGHLVVRR